MKRRLKICLQIIWLSAAVAILFMGTDMCVSTDAACYQAGQTMLFLMFWLSFPTSILFVIGALIFLDGAVHSPSDFIFSWFVMGLSGLLQWFVVMPRLFETHHFTVLNLETVPSRSFSSDDVPALVAGDARMPVAADENTTVVEVTSGASKAANITSRRPRTPRTIPRPVAAFDKRGRTPFERVIDRL